MGSIGKIRVKNRSLLWFTGILLAVHALFFFSQLSTGRIYLSDSLEYLEKSNNISAFFSAENDNPMLPEAPERLTRRTPGYPFLIYLTAQQNGHHYLLLVLQNLLSMASVFIAFSLFRTENESPRRIWIYLILIVLFPAQFIYANMVMAEALFQFLLVSALWFLRKYLHSGKLYLLLLMNLALALAAFTKPVLYPFLFLSMLAQIAWFIYSWKVIHSLPSLIPVVLVLLYCQYNKERTGFFHFSSIQIINQVNYNLYLFEAGRSGYEAASETIDRIYAEASEKGTFADRMKYLSQSSKDRILADPFHYLVFHLKGCVRFFIDPGRFDLAQLAGLSESPGMGFMYYIQTHSFGDSIRYFFAQKPLWLLPALLLIFTGNILKLAGLGISLFTLRKDKTLKISVFLLMGYICFATGPLGASRFFMPISILVAALASKVLTRDIFLKH